MQPPLPADLLKYRLGARRYAGPVSQLAPSEPPAPVQPVRSGPGPLRLMAKRASKALRSLRRRRKARERTGGRMPFRPHRWFGKPKRTEADKDNGNGAGSRKGRRRNIPKTPDQVRGRLWQAVAVPQAALADGPGEGWSSDEIEFQPSQPVEGRRLFVEGLIVTGGRASVTLRAATGLDLRVRAFGGSQGRSVRFWGSASLDEGKRTRYSLPLHDPQPSLTFSWEDALGQAGAVTLKGGQLSYSLPAIDGVLCDLRVASLGWTPGSIGGVVASECVARIEEPVELQTVAGHASVTETALMDADVTAITGTVSAATGASHASVPFVAGGETRFRLPVGAGEAVHAVTIDVGLEATLRIPIPPLTQLTTRNGPNTARRRFVSCGPGPAGGSARR